MTIRKKLIEVSIPLEAINVASAREKSIRHGHPSTLHLWWARRPLAACRAVLFAQLVDDPSSWPERFDHDEEKIEAERRRLHKVIEQMVEWPSDSKPGDRQRFESAVEEARWEIARSVAWGLGEEPPARDDGAAIFAYLQEKAPPVYDPFCGGGSIPLEAQRLGLRAYGSDLNPVAVLISKALVEIPPKFAGRPPVHPRSEGREERSEKKNRSLSVTVMAGRDPAIHEKDVDARHKAGHDEKGMRGKSKETSAASRSSLLFARSYKGAQGLAEDVRYYGKWMRDEAERRVGHLYPKAQLPDGSEATVIAWLWARTVRSPDPRAKGAMVPLVSSFMLSTKEAKKAWVEPMIDPTAPDGWRFEVRTGALGKADEERLKQGTKGGDRGSTFSCVLSGASIRGGYIKAEGMAGRMGKRLMAIVAEGSRKRVYLSPVEDHEQIACDFDTDLRVTAAREGAALNQPVPERLTGGTCYSYGLTTFGKLFTSRQLVALTSFTDLVGEAREKVLADARLLSLSKGGLPDDPTPLHKGGAGPTAYADAVATYFGLAVDRMADRHSSLTRWDPNPTGYAPKIANTFSRQALPMVWDYTEGNPFSSSSGNFEDAVQWVTKNIRVLGTRGCAEVNQIDVAKNNFPVRPIVIATDPPYYDNIGYADLSDFFYVWLKRSAGAIWPDLFRRLTTPKNEELVATPYRHGGRVQAETFFMDGMSAALIAMRKAATEGEPLTIYYAFKQSELAEEGIVSPGWASFLQAIFDGGLSVDATWPVRTELSNRMIAKNASALASSVVHVCRKRPENAPTVTRADFLRALRGEMPEAVDNIRKASVGPVDMPQSVIGPGMGVFTRYARVLEDDDSPMSVKTALALINRVWGEIENDLDTNFDPETQVALAWFATYGFDARASGDLIGMANAKNIPIEALFRSGVFQNLHGKAGLTPREKLPEGWSPATDRSATVWECVQHTARVLRAQDGGAEPAARLVAAMGARAEDARALAYRLYEIASQKGWAAEALVYNELAQDWTQLEGIAADIDAATALPAQGALAL